MGIGKAFLLLPLVLGLNGCLGLWALDAVLPEEDEPEQAAEAEAVAESDNSFGEAVNAATAAAEGAQTARTARDWVRVADGWAAAIASLKAVPASSENYQTAQQKIPEYQANYDYASNNASAAKNNEAAAAARKIDESVQAMKDYLLVIDPDKEFLLDAQIIGDDDRYLGIAVTTAWARMPQETQELFLFQAGKAWANQRSPSKPNETMVFVVDIGREKILGRYDAGGPHIMD